MQQYITEQAGEQWLYRKDIKRYYGLLQDLCGLLNMLYPRVRTVADNELLRPESLTAQEVFLYDQLLHGLTALHHPYRVSSNEGLLSTQEDQVLVLRLLQPYVWPQTLVNKHLRRVYLELVQHFWPQSFTAREAIFALRQPRSNVYRWLCGLERAGYIVRSGGNKSRGYSYEIQAWPWEK